MTHSFHSPCPVPLCLLLYVILSLGNKMRRGRWLMAVTRSGLEYQEARLPGFQPQLPCGSLHRVLHLWTPTTSGCPEDWKSEHRIWRVHGTCVASGICTTCLLLLLLLLLPTIYIQVTVHSSWSSTYMEIMGAAPWGPGRFSICLSLRSGSWVPGIEPCLGLSAQ